MAMAGAATVVPSLRYLIWPSAGSTPIQHPLTCQLAQDWTWLRPKEMLLIQGGPPQSESAGSQRLVLLPAGSTTGAVNIARPLTLKFVPPNTPRTAHSQWP